MREQAPPLAHHFATLEQQHEASTLGMWLFLVTEVMLFGGLFTAYTVFRTHYPEAFSDASHHLNLLLGGTNTVVLISSSLTMALAVYGAQTGNQRMLMFGLALTFALGVAFLGIKAVEYYKDYQEKLVPGLAFDMEQWRKSGDVNHPWHVMLFLTLYYFMTGLHALHMIIGLGLLTVVTQMSARRRFSPIFYTPVELMGLYWHFVDIVWIFLFPLLYLIRH